ncbi:helix-turn-helix domain-containing protein [Marinoscillum sp. MHG1-6]|uniref:helix-turn-helix domain-containing protein n=1 Tax=Marinoscillum sp. MHG1-6 TaxID=2959627 RepID=UPI00215820B6|nr:helix-turn-helix domain-containing protein [Marinoscillum sp. MHG1-6]
MSTPDQLISQLNEQVEANLHNEQFSVDQLAESVGMSRSTLHRKLHELTGQSISQFIREYRLERSLDLLQNENLTASEVAHRVGFGSATYFSKSFHEFFGFTPGDAKDGKIPERKHSTSANKRKTPLLGIGVLIIVVITAGYFAFSDSTSKPVQELEKSIAILPFRNDSHDSSNVYIVNGLMESILNNLGSIEDLRVISRTSVEQYRKELNNKPLTEIGKELNVSYIVEGSGQKYGDEMLLSIQLIEVPTDRHIWSKQYKRKADNIIDLQIEVAKNIATEIKALITEDENERIEKLPTTNEKAFEFYLKGNEILFPYERWRSGYDTVELKKARAYFRKAIALDNTFVQAHAKLSQACLHLNWSTNDRYKYEMNTSAETAMFLDPNLPESIIAKLGSFYYQGRKDWSLDNDSAFIELRFLLAEKAAKLDPGNIMALRVARNSLGTRLNADKALEYSLRCAQLDIERDSSEIQLDFGYLPTDLRLNGFFEEAQAYINKATELGLEMTPDQIFLTLDWKHDYEAGKSIFKNFLHQHPDQRNRNILGLIFFMQRQYDSAYYHFKSEKDERYSYRLGFVCEKLGYFDEAKKNFEAVETRLSNSTSRRPLQLFWNAEIYAAMGETEKALKCLETYASQDYLHYVTIRFMKDSPIFDELREHSEFQRLLKQIETKFWETHDEIEKSLLEKGLL